VATANHNGFSAVLQSWGDLTTAWIAIASELTDYSAQVFNNTVAAVTQVAFASTIKDVVDIQSEYTKKTYYEHLAELSKLYQMCVRPDRRVEQQTSTWREVESSLPSHSISILTQLVNLKWADSSVVRSDEGLASEEMVAPPAVA